MPPGSRGAHERAAPTHAAGRGGLRAFLGQPSVIVAVVILGITTLAAVAPGLLAPTDPWDCDLARSLQPPSRSHIFGVDLQGCDYLTRVIHGARASLLIGGGATLMAVVIALVAGTAAGYLGGTFDAIAARLADVWFAIPTLLGAMVLLSVMRAPSGAGVATVIALFGWPVMFRVHRSAVIAVRVRGHVDAARGLGATNVHIVTRHVLPHAVPSLLAHATLFTGVAVTAEATLTYLGLGLQLPAISWGLMISSAQRRVLEHPHLLLFPGTALVAVVASLVMLGDALRSVLGRSGQ